MQALPDDHSKLVPLLPIPNRTVKRLSANDSADSRVKVGHRQAVYTKPQLFELGFFYGLRIGFSIGLRWPIHNHIHNMGLDCLRGIYLGAREGQNAVLHADFDILLILI